MAMSSSREGFHLLVLLVLLQLQVSYSLNCSSQTFTKNRHFNHCDDLPKLKSFIHWTFNETNHSLNLAFTAPPPEPTGWVAWAINPDSIGMVGSQALVAFAEANGSMNVNTYNVSSYASIEPSKISFQVLEMEAEFAQGLTTIYASAVLPKSYGSVVNHVWQVGRYVKDGIPMSHDFAIDNFVSQGRLDLARGKSIKVEPVGVLEDANPKKKYTHGILNAVSWGFLFPAGVIIARYVKTFQSADPAWFYLHVSCQICAYAIGVAGWWTGIELGSSLVFHTRTIRHRIVGITLFCLATLQILALFLRPNKDNKYRKYWNVYHHGVGYVIIFLGFANVIEGLSILRPGSSWVSAYVMVLGGLTIISILLEIVKLIERRKSSNPYVEPNGA